MGRLARFLPTERTDGIARAPEVQKSQPAPAAPPPLVQRPVVEVTGAYYIQGGERLPLASPRGPRPPPLALGPAALPIERLFYGKFGGDFNAVEAHLHTVEEGYLVIGTGWDGAILDADRRLLLETGAFTPHSVMAPAVYPLELPERLQPEVLRNCAIGFDAAYWNLYHWLTHGLGRSWLVSREAPDATLLFPDWSFAPQGPPRVDRQVLEDSLQVVFGGEPSRVRRLPPGVYRVENLQFVWTYPIPPTELVELVALQEMYDLIRRRVAGPPKQATRRLYFARDAAIDPRLAADDQPALAAVLEAHGFERLLLERMSFVDQVRAASEAEIIMGPHGAGLVNMVFSPREALIVELQRKIGGEEHLRPWFYQLATVRGQRYAAIDTERPGWVADLDAALARMPA